MSPLKALVDAVRSIPRRSQNIVRRLRNEPILRADGSTTGTLDAHATPEEKLKQAAGASNVKDQRNAWMDLIMGKQFDDILDETFAKCAALNTSGGKDPRRRRARSGCAGAVQQTRRDDGRDG